MFLCYLILVQLFPSAVRVGFRVLTKADKKIVSVCEAYLDPVVTIVVLVLVVIGTILGLIFAATQVYAEGDHLVRVGVNLINSTVSQHPEINKVLPEGWQGIMDSMAGNAYLYGRESITNMIRDSISEKNPAKAEQIEKQVIELWDRIYLAWNQTWDTGKDLHKVRRILPQIICCDLVQQINFCPKSLNGINVTHYSDKSNPVVLQDTYWM